MSDLKNDGIAGESAFSFAFPAAVNEPEYQFEVTIEKVRGAKVIERKTLSQANPVAGTWNSGFVDGALAIEIN